jgi:OOP family OmpA-OmpF porin
VPDTLDMCPNTPRGDVVDSRGCSCDVTVQLQFAFNSAVLSAGDKAKLNDLAATIRSLDFIVGQAVGHTDNVGSATVNQSLSERRAKAVTDYLASQGVAPGRIEVIGKGLSEPIADNATAEGRALNRRVVLKRTNCTR